MKEMVRRKSKSDGLEGNNQTGNGIGRMRSKVTKYKIGVEIVDLTERNR